MSRAMNRAQTKARLVELVRADSRMAGKTVAYGSIQEGIPGEGVWFGKISGQITYPHQQAGRKDRDDEFQITVEFWTVRPGKTAEEAELAAQAMFEVLDDLCADDPTLGGTVQPGRLLSSLIDDATIDSGPLEQEGHWGMVRASVRCKSRLS